jgi:hypothetical protein
MRLSFGDIMDSIDGTIGYIIRIFSEGLTTRNREAELYTLPGIFCRPNDADEDTVGTEDCIVIENGDDRIIIATKNAKAWGSLISYLSRDLDKGETVLTSEDGTARGYISVRPNGDVYVSADNGTNSVTMEWDASTGDLNVDADGDILLDPTGTVHAGGVVTDFATKFNALKASYDTHTHLYNPGPGGAVATATPLPLLPTSIRSTKLEVQ